MGLFDKLFKKMSGVVKNETHIPAIEKPLVKPEARLQSPQAAEPKQKTDFTVVVKREYKEHDPVGEINRLDFGKPLGSLGCFLNYDPKQLCEPTERQLNYAKSLGLFIPDGLTSEDISCMISRVTGDDALESPGLELVALAVGLGLKFSAYIGADGLLRQIIRRSKERDLAALYVYAVHQSAKGVDFGNMLEDPDADRFYAFADVAVASPSLLKSIKGREPGDFLKPHKGTAAYKAAASFLSGGDA